MANKRGSLALIIGAALVALAFAAPVAGAATEVRDATTEELCPPVYPPIDKENAPWTYTNNPQYPEPDVPPYESGGCSAHFAGVETVSVENTHSGRVPCTVDFDLHMGPDGWGYIDNVDYRGCNGTMWSQHTFGSRIVMPPGQTLAPEFIEPYVHEDADTDFSVEMFPMNLTSVGNYNGRWAFVSMDVDTDLEREYSQMTIDNQVPSGPEEGSANPFSLYNFGGGLWHMYWGTPMTFTHE